MKAAGKTGFVIVGASGDLARTKIIPALFALYGQGYLPEDFRVFGFGRTLYDTPAFREKLSESLACRLVFKGECEALKASFLARCHYFSGAYDTADSFLDLCQFMRAQEGDAPVNRLFYMAIPPEVFLPVARSLAAAGLIVCDEKQGWSRVVVEKPFGRDRESSDQLVAELGRVFVEDQTYRIDHYLGKELVQNLMALRFANRVFEPLWSRDHIQSVHVVWKENASLAGRAGYFDRTGIIRDVVQNHLLQIIALVGMEPPAQLKSTAIRDAKVALLRAIQPVALEDMVVGQYDTYRKEQGVPPDSRTPTYAAMVLRIRNSRWQGVPFFVEAGKGVDERVSEVRIRFRPGASALFGAPGILPANELVIRIQPDEAINLRIMNKTPGLAWDIQPSDLRLLYRDQYRQDIPEAYERLLLDVMLGDRGLFIRADELAAAWDIVTPALHGMERRGIGPERYAFGSAGPAWRGAATGPGGQGEFRVV
jgi:glucose-6-phosphate 1-dehydrogenase